MKIALNLEKSITIQKPVDQVFSTVADFKSWPLWSPWLCQEPECKTDIGGTAGTVGHWDTWDGKFIGSGKNTISEIEKNKKIICNLEFLKPWKSTSRVEFFFEGTGSSCKVTWTMQGSLPIFMFFFKKMMTALIASDYERGLQMLKEYCETGKVLSKVEVKGVVSKNGFYYVGKRVPCATKDVGPSMQKHFGELDGLIKSGKIPAPKFGFSFYHKFDFVNGQCEYTAGMAYDKSVEAPAGLVSGHIENHHAIEVDHFGPYKHLGNAWMTAYGRQRGMKKKLLKKIDSYEIYKTMPGMVSDDKIHTEIFLPVK